jgi:16S rRNA (cytosine1402-N4)-methyltransferase
MNEAHVPVMLEEVIDLLDPRPGGRFVDATVGLGGHAARIAERVGPEGAVIGMDRDAETLERAADRLAGFGAVVQLIHARFGFVREVVEGAGLDDVDGVLLDLGVSSVHLDSPERGFSFRPEAAQAPLDMRMDRSRGVTAAQLIQRLEADELAERLRDGGAPAARGVASALKAHQPLETVGDLLDALRGVRMPRRKHHPATLVFQALRIAVNAELEELDSGLAGAVDVLAPGGRLAVLSYHSGEDRRVKRFMADEARGCVCPPDLPVCACGRSPRLKLLVRGQAPSDLEVSRNPRARSARLRGAARC